MSLGKIFIVLLIVGWTGCATQAPKVKLRIAGGQKLMVNLGQGGTIEGESSKELKVTTAGFLANIQTKKGNYFFSFDLKTAATPLSVKIEDVTDDNVILMVDDHSPKLVGRSWRWIGPVQGPEDKGLKWIHEIDESFRVFLFTITLNDGRQIVLHHAAFYPAFVKARMRFELGLETP